ncbi:MAG: DUF6263 family protein [Sedimentisphaerales bacterium]|jgi:hypothetical protein
MKNLEFRIKNGKLKAVGCLSGFSILNSQFLICFVGAMFCSVAMADSLKFKFAPGDRYSLVSVTEQKMTGVVDGNERTSEQNIRLECDFDIEEVDDSGCAWAKYTYKRVTMKLRLQEQKVEFDSDANQLKTPMQAAPLRLAMGEELYLRITPQGRIERINGLQALITSAKAKMGNFAGASRVSQGINQLFAEPAVRRELEDQLRIFPESNEEGATWGRTEILSSTEAGYAQTEQIEEVNIVFEKTFRLNPDKSGQGGIAVVDVNLVIKSASAPVLSAPAPESSIRANREISGEGAGRIEIEEATGRIISSKMTQDMTERIKYVAQGPMLRPPPAPEPTTTHTVTTFQMTRREPPAPGKVEGDKPARPADANEKGA